MKMRSPFGFDPLRIFPAGGIIGFMKMIDLHVHTTASDGTLTPTETVERAKALGLAAVAITDHDTHAGVAEAAAAGARYGVEAVPGIELSVHYRGLGIHILGYFIRPGAPALDALLAWVSDERARRNEAIAAALRADGYPVYVEELRDQTKNPGAVIGRPHFAAKLVELGAARDMRDAFGRFLGEGRKYYRERAYIPMDMAFGALRAAGGKAVFAHPYQYALPEPELLALTGTLVKAGIVGVECVYSGYTAEQTEYLKRLAAHYGLCATGGSDFHGAEVKPGVEMGGAAVPYEFLEELKRR